MTLTNEWTEAEREDRKEKLQTCSHFLFLFLGVTLALSQASLKLLWHALIAVFTHRPQINLHKLIPEPYKARHEERGRTGIIAGSTEVQKMMSIATGERERKERERGGKTLEVHRERERAAPKLGK